MRLVWTTNKESNKMTDLITIGLMLGILAIAVHKHVKAWK
jgi:hypothetical protein